MNFWQGVFTVGGALFEGRDGALQRLTLDGTVGPLDFGLKEVAGERFDAFQLPTQFDSQIKTILNSRLAIMIELWEAILAR